MLDVRVEGTPLFILVEVEIQDSLSVEATPLFFWHPPYA